jgi:integrase
MQDWLENTYRNNIEESTYQGNKLILEVHIKPYFEKNYSEFMLSDIKAMHLQKYFDYKSKCGRSDGKGGLGGNTLRKHKAVFKPFFDYCIRMQLMISNPIVNVVLPKLEKYTGSSIYTPQQIEQLLKIVKGTIIEAPVLITCYYGLRRGEILGLKWQNINFDENTLTIKDTRVFYNKEIKKDSAKNVTSNRTLPLIPVVANYLKILQEKQNENKALLGRDYIDNGGYICCWDNGKLYNISLLNHRLKSMLEASNMPHIRFHDLRHSTASFLIKQGFSFKEVSVWLGHSDIQTTANIYTHIDNEQKENMAKMLNKSFSLEDF